MTMPDFFSQAPTITLHDPLARFLGAGDGTVTYAYEDAVKLAGHSCPTVAGTWLMLVAGLARLWPRGRPERGAIRVFLPEPEDAGTTGVVAAVASLVTGARGDDGFKGIAGRFDRRGLLFFDVPMPGALGLQRMDNGARVAASFDPSSVPPDERMRPLLQKWAGGQAGDDEVADFGQVWQDRVRRILTRPSVVRVEDWG